MPDACVNVSSGGGCNSPIRPIDVASPRGGGYAADLFVEIRQTFAGVFKFPSGYKYTFGRAQIKTTRLALDVDDFDFKIELGDFRTQNNRVKKT